MRLADPRGPREPLDLREVHAEHAQLVEQEKRDRLVPLGVRLGRD